MKKVFTGVVVLAGLVIFGAGGFYINNGGKSQTATVATALGDITIGETDSSTDTVPSSLPAPLAESVPTTKQVTADMRGYENRAFHFGLLYPKELVATEYKEANGALSVTFQNPSTSEGFDIYVTPYSGKQIDTARFKLDQPSGVMKEPTDVVIDGAKATMFFGKNAIMGETREVWFIHGGFLYEVATYKDLDTWLASIMQTWKFL